MTHEDSYDITWGNLLDFAQLPLEPQKSSYSFFLTYATPVSKHVCLNSTHPLKQLFDYQNGSTLKTNQLLTWRKTLLHEIVIACPAMVQYCSNCLIPIEGCSWDIEIVCKAGSALFSRTVSLSVRSDKHWTVITPICGCIAQHNPAQSSHAHNTAHQAHLDRKIDSNY